MRLQARRDYCSENWILYFYRNVSQTSYSWTSAIKRDQFPSLYVESSMLHLEALFISSWLEEARLKICESSTYNWQLTLQKKKKSRVTIPYYKCKQISQKFPRNRILRSLRHGQRSYLQHRVTRWEMREDNVRSEFSAGGKATSAWVVCVCLSVCARGEVGKCER